jgi:chromosome segregation ATPase
VAAARRHGEERYNDLQGDVAALHDLVTALRNDKAAQARAFEEERDAQDRKVAESAHRLALAQEQAAKTETELRAINTALGSEVASLKADAASRSERHFTMLTALQNAVRQLRAEAEQGREDLAVLSQALRSLHSRVGETLNTQQAPLAAWYEDVQRAFLFLMDTAEAAKKARAEAEAEARALALALEDSRSARALLEDRLARVDQDVQAHKARTEDLAALLQARERTAQEAARTAASLREDLEADLARTKASLDRATRTNVALQGDNARLASEVAEAAAKQSARTAALEEQAASLQTSVRTLQGQVDALGEERSRLSTTCELQLASIEQLRREKVQLSAAAEQSSSAVKAAVASYAAQVAALTENQKKMDGQLRQTQALLAVVQEQRRTLQEANTQLKQELDERYRQMLAAPAQPSASSASSMSMADDAAASISSMVLMQQQQQHMQQQINSMMAGAAGSGAAGPDASLLNVSQYFPGGGPTSPGSTSSPRSVNGPASASASPAGGNGPEVNAVDEMSALLQRLKAKASLSE